MYNNWKDDVEIFHSQMKIHILTSHFDFGLASYIALASSILYTHPGSKYCINVNSRKFTLKQLTN